MIDDSTQHTVTVTNHDDTVDGFFISVYMPNNNSVGVSDVKVGGLYRSDFTLEIEKPNVIYDGYTTYRWIFSEPTEFDGISSIQ